MKWLFLVLAVLGLGGGLVLMLPDATEQAIYQKLTDAGYQQIDIEKPVWSLSGVRIQRLHATGKGLPDIDLQQLEGEWLLSRLWLGDLGLSVQLDIASGTARLDGYVNMWGGSQWVLGVEAVHLSDIQKRLLQIWQKDILQGFSEEGLLWATVALNSDAKNPAQQQLTANVSLKEVEISSANGAKLGIEAAQIKQLSMKPDLQLLGALSIQANNVNIVHEQHQAALDELTLEHISKLEAFERLRLKGLRLMVGEGQWFGLQQGSLDTSHWYEKTGQFQSELVTLENGDVQLMRDEQGNIQPAIVLMKALTEGWGSQSEVDTGEAEHSVVEISLTKLDVKDVHLNMLDQSVSPAAKVDAMILKAEVLDIKYPLSDEPLHWQASGMIGELGTWDSYGELKLAASDGSASADLESNVQIKSMPLSPLSPYFEAKFNSGILSGNSDINLTVKNTGGEIHLQGDVSLRKPQLKSNGGISSFGSTWSLDSALDVLRDDDGNVAIDIDADGRADDPSFKLGKVWDKVLKEALQSTSLMYLTQTMQPYGLALSVGKALYEAGKIVELRSIGYEPHTMTLDNRSPDLEGYSDKIVGLLQAKEALVLEICPKYPVAEQEDGVNLSHQRLKSMIASLLQRGLPTERISICEPALDKTKVARPRLELRLI